MTAIAQQQRIEAVSQIRVARPTDKLSEVATFYHDGLGLPILTHFEDHEGYSGVMLGIPGESFHLEFTHFVAGSPCPAPSKDNLLVLYFANHQSFLDRVQRMADRGHTPVEPENPYWKGKSFTFEDPDGWRVVLYDGLGLRKQG